MFSKRGMMDSKAQTWYMDFIIGLLLFIFTLIVYFSYTNNFQNEEKGGLNELLKDSEAVSSSLVLSGYPPNWNNETVARIGIADEQKINETKVRYFREINYSKTKKIFATPYDYLVFFVGNSGQVLNVNGVCGVGSPLVNLTYKIRSAYYYQDPADSFLKDFMKSTFNADIYFADDGSNLADIDGLISNISKYGMLVMEQPALPNSVYNNYKDELENFSSTGGKLMISGQLTSAQGRNLVGATFYKLAGQSSSDLLAIVNKTDQYLALNVGDKIKFRQGYYVENNTASSLPALGFTRLASFNLTNDMAIAKWQYGNGTVYFISDFDVTYFSGDFIGAVEDTVRGFIEGFCNPINVSNINLKKLAKAERYLGYNSEIVKMVVYIWE